MSTERMDLEIKAPPPQIGPTIARPQRPRVKKQFGLATLLLLVLWLASAISIWFYWQPWEIVGEFDCDYSFVHVYSSDSSKLLLGTNAGLVIIDPRSGRVLDKLPLLKDNATNVRLSENWDRVACTVSKPGFNAPTEIQIHNLKSGALEQTLAFSGIGGALKFSTNGERLYAGNIWKLVSAFQRGRDQPVWNIPPPNDPIFLPDPSAEPVKRTADEEKRIRECERAVLDAQTMSALERGVKALSAIPNVSSQVHLYLSPYADRAVARVGAMDATRAFSWDLVEDRRIAELEDFPSYAAPFYRFTEDGRGVGMMDRDTQRFVVWDLETGRKQSNLKLPTGHIVVAFSRDGRLAASQAEGATSLWECSTGRLIKEIPKIWQYLYFAPDSRRLACITASGNPEVVLFDTESGEQLCSLPAPMADCDCEARFSPDGRGMVIMGSNSDGTKAMLYGQHHPETAHGWLAMPVAWLFIALTLLQLWRFFRRAKTATPA